MTVPELPLLIFDGDCAFCSSSVRVGQRRIKRMPRAEPYQFLELEQFICDVLNITALPSTAHEYSFIHEGNAASQPSLQKHLPEEVESNNLVFPGDV